MDSIKIEHDALLLKYKKESYGIDNSFRELRLKLKLKSDESERLQNCLDTSDSIIKTNKIENEALREKLDMVKAELNRLYNTQGSKEQFLAERLQVMELKLSEYELVAKEIEKTVSSLVEQDEEWRDIYVKQIMSVPLGPKKLGFITQLLSRLEAKIREVSIIRKEMDELKQLNKRLFKEKQDAIDLLATSKGGLKNVADMVYEKQDQLREAIRENERNKNEYHILVRERMELLNKNSELTKKLDLVMIRKERIENIQRVLIGVLERYQDDDLLEQLNSIKL